MQKLVVAVVFGSVFASAPLAAFAGSQKTEAKLAAPVDKPVKVIIDGRSWSCVGDVCQGKGLGYDQPLRRECARVSKVVGEIVAYRNGGRSLDEAGIAACKPS